jgi:hypothetical protein
MIKRYWVLCIFLFPSLLSAQTSNGNPQPMDEIKGNLRAGGEGDSVPQRSGVLLTGLLAL